jgi:hypothetical protein
LHAPDVDCDRFSQLVTKIRDIGTGITLSRCRGTNETTPSFKFAAAGRCGVSDELPARAPSAENRAACRSRPNSAGTPPY